MSCIPVFTYRFICDGCGKEKEVTRENPNSSEVQRVSPIGWKAVVEIGEEFRHFCPVCIERKK